MGNAGAVLNLVLGLCAVAYSWLPPARIRNYSRGLALTLRVMGLFLIALASASVWLDRVR